MLTPSEEVKRSILVAELDKDFLNSVHSDPKINILAPISVATVKDAQLALANRTNRFLAIVINPYIDRTNCLSVIRFARINRPTTPIFVIHDDEPPFNEEEQKLLGIEATLKKPITYSHIVDLIAPHIISLDSNHIESQLEAPIGKEVTVEDSNFISIRSEDFLAGSKSIFNLFVRLASGRYIKILNTHESFDPERLMSYFKKGVTTFYLEKSAQIDYLNYCDRLATAFIKSKKLSLDIKIKGTLVHGEETMNFLKSQGLNSGTIQFAQNFVKNVELLIQNSKFLKNEKIISFVNDFAKYDHAVSVTMIASLLGRALTFDGERAVKILGLATLLHDIGLVGLPEECQFEDESLLSPMVLTEYRKHPLTGSQILAELQLDQMILQGVEQHHERRTRTGFPAKLGVGSINKIAEIIGISDDFIRIVRKFNKDPILQIYQVYSEMNNNVFQHFSYDIVEGFRKVFFPADKRFQN